MAAKKRSSKKTSSKQSSSAQKSSGVMVPLDSEAILVLKTAIETLAEFATAIATASDDPIVKGSVRPSAGKSGGAKKRSAKKKAAKK